MSYKRKIDVNPFNSISTIIMIVVFLFALIYLVKGIFWILSFVAPLLLIATLIIDREVIFSYGRMILNLLKRNPLMGIGAAILTFLAFPVVAAFLFSKALFKRKINQIQEEMTTKREGEFADFEEMDSKPLELPQMEKREKEIRNNYENFFDE